MDECDKGDLVDEFVHSKELQFRYSVLQPVNVCHWCQSPVNSSTLFCDKDCAMTGSATTACAESAMEFDNATR